MGNLLTLKPLVEGVNDMTSLLVPSYNPIQAPNLGEIQARLGHPVTTGERTLEVEPTRLPLNPMTYDEVKANEAQMAAEGFLDPSVPEQAETPTGAPTEAPTEAPAEEGGQPAGSTGDQGADAMIAELMKLDDGTLRGAERMVQNFDAIAAAYAQRTGRNMQADLFSLQPGRRRETEYTPFLNPRNY